LTAFEREVIDRFGPLPTAVIDLFDSVKMKWIGMQFGLEKILMKQHKMVGYFVPDQSSGFFDSVQFSKILNYVQNNSKSCTLKEKQTRGGLRLLLTFSNVKSVQQGLTYLRSIAS
jgi:transcription-repair coupling factor (superfamily II helicase)